MQVMVHKKESCSPSIVPPSEPFEVIRAQFALVSEELEIDEAEHEGVVLSSQFLGPDKSS